MAVDDNILSQWQDRGLCELVELHVVDLHLIVLRAVLADLPNVLQLDRIEFGLPLLPFGRVQQVRLHRLCSCGYGLADLLRGCDMCLVLFGVGLLLELHQRSACTSGLFLDLLG